jgi:rRNA maturation RNase YbeY
MLQINYQNQTHYKMDEYVEVFKKIAKHTLKKFNMKGNIELSVTLVSRNTIKDINNQYRHIDKVTDVISFENDEGKKFEHEFVLDFTPYTDAVHKSEKTIHHVAQHLEELSREVRHMATGFHKPHVLIEKYDEYQLRMAAIQEQLKKSAAVDMSGQKQVSEPKVTVAKEHVVEEG